MRPPHRFRPLALLLTLVILAGCGGTPAAPTRTTPTSGGAAPLATATAPVATAAGPTREATGAPSPAATRRATSPPSPASAATAQASPVAATGITGLRVQGNHLVDGAGQPVRLLGVNRAGSEYACIQGWGIFEGPTDDAAIAAMKSWRINAVRVPLNEQCWLGINGVKPEYGGATYQAAIRVYVNALNAAGLAVILELHWSAPGATKATEQQPMPNRDHSVEFWRQVAAAYKDHSSVLFDLFNEPIPDNNRDTAEAWRCWRDGGSCAGLNYQVAGMQELVDAVRGAGATNVLLLGGVQYAARLSKWLEYRPNDPTGNLAASWHMYNFSWCKEPSCWDSEVAPLAAQVPLIAGEIGQDDCATAFIERLMAWLDARGGSYLGWTWNTWNCGQGGPSLISDFNGTPTPYGRGFRDHLAKVAAPAR